MQTFARVPLEAQTVAWLHDVLEKSPTSHHLAQRWACGDPP